MAINKQTIISAFDDKLTLLQWLKTINKALDKAVLTGVEVRQKGNATFTFVVTFEDGTELESNRFVLAQGESINGATIRNGHLYLSLTNGDELDAGNVKPVTSFEINASQHLIVNYGDGTSQDLGAIFTGNINVDGKVSANILESNEYIRPKNTDEQINISPNFLGISKTIATTNADITEGVTSGSGAVVFDFAKARVSNGKLNIVIAGHLTINSDNLVIGYRTRMPNWKIILPDTILSKIYPIDGGLYNVILGGKTYCYIASNGDVPPNSNSFKENAIFYSIAKSNNYIDLTMSLSNATYEANSTFSFRFETNLILWQTTIY